LLDVPQPSMLKTSSAQANAVKRFLRFTAKYLQKEIFRIVAASVTSGKVTKVTTPYGRQPRSHRASARPQTGHRAPPVPAQNVYNQLMLDPVPGQNTDPPTSPQTAQLPSAPVTDFHIGDEFGTARRNLPPAGIVAICIAAVAIILGIFAFTERPKPQGTGAIDFVTAAEVSGQDMILAAITITLRNTTDKPLWIHTLKAELKTADGQTFEDKAASVVDLDRYFQAFPALKESAEPPLAPETKLLAGTAKKGTIIVGFKVTKEAFDHRTSLTVAVQPYDQVLPVILK